MEHTTDAFDQLPNLESPTLDEEMAAVLKSDKTVLLELCLLIDLFTCTWSEKMAIGLYAYGLIDTSDTKPFKVTLAQGEISAPLQQACRLVKKLSPQALAELANSFLEEDFEFSEIKE